MANGIKFGVIATENSGKTTLISKLQDALVMSTDNKAFRGKVPHFRQSEYTGINDLIETIAAKLEAYEEKFEGLPRTLVVDSVTHLANNMEKYWNEKATGFAIWAGLGKEILEFNAYLEDVIIPNGINVVFTSHCQFDKDTNRYSINAPGNFGKNGSWLSVTDEAGFIEVKGSKRIFHLKTMKFPCRTLHDDLPDSVDIEDFDINKHIELLESSAAESEEWSI
jgi:hypothetical protein